MERHPMRFIHGGEITSLALILLAFVMLLKGLADYSIYAPFGLVLVATFTLCALAFYGSPLNDSNDDDVSRR